MEGALLPPEYLPHPRERPAAEGVKLAEVSRAVAMQPPHSGVEPSGPRSEPQSSRERRRLDALPRNRGKPRALASPARDRAATIPAAVSRTCVRASSSRRAFGFHEAALSMTRSIPEDPPPPPRKRPREV